MTYLLTQIFLCLLAAFLLGLVIGWWIARRRCRDRISELEAEVADVNAALTACEESRASGSGGSAESAAAVSGVVSGLAAAASTAEPDDLQRVWGIGPKMESLLNEAGIHTFATLAETPVSKLREIVAAYGSKRLTDIANEEVWPEQAAMAARGDWDALKEYQEQLSWREGGGKPT